MSSPSITIYTSGFCPYCVWAKRMLDSKGVSFNEIRTDMEASAREEMLQRSNGQMTVPQIFIDEIHVGGYTDMAALDRDGKLDPLLFPN